MNELSLGAIFFSAFFVNNIILIRFLGLCSFFGVSGKTESALGMGLAVIFVSTISSAISWLVYNFILLPLNLVFLRTIVFIFVIACVVQMIELFLHKTVPKMYHSLGIYLPLITTNCLILGTAFLSIDYKLNFLQTIIYSLGVSGGYALVIVIFATIREKLELAPIPQSLKGSPFAFLLSALMSLAFLGFKGLFGL